MSVKATPVDAVAGFVKPGDRVDIMYVERIGRREDPVGHPPAADAVLAVNMVNTLDEKTGAAIPQVESVTLAVNDKQGSLLALADEKGKLKLLLTETGRPTAPRNEGRGDRVDGRPVRGAAGPGRRPRRRPTRRPRRRWSRPWWPGSRSR